jgi:hypothetical protein
MVKGKFSFNWKERELRCKSRSKYGIKVEDLLFALQDLDSKSDDSNKKK